MSVISYWGYLCLALLALYTAPTLAMDAGDSFWSVGYANIDAREDIEEVIVGKDMVLGGLSMESQQMAIATGTIMLSPDWGIELLLPLASTSVTFDGEGGVLDGMEIGSAEVKPSSVIVQYYPAEFSWGQPYLGLGVNYTRVNHVQINQQTAAMLGVDKIHSLSIDDSFGVVLQLGVDIPLTNRLSINLSSSFVDVNTQTRSQFTSNGVLLESSSSLNLKKRPNLSVVGISYKF